MIKPLVDQDELNSTDITAYYLKNPKSNGLVYYYYDLFEDFELDKIVSIGNRLVEIDGVVNSESKLELDTRNSKISWVPINRITEWIYQRLTQCVNYVNFENYEYDLERIESLQFTKYFGNSNGFYKPHLDSLNGESFDDRKLSFVLQLSDPSEYEGGELRIHLGKDPKIVEKKKGLITFFPSNTLHECTPVTDGNRYVLVGWVIGPKFK